MIGGGSLPTLMTVSVTSKVPTVVKVRFGYISGRLR